MLASATAKFGYDPDGGVDDRPPKPADVLAFWRAAGPEKWFRKDQSI
jgi:hypothetical protein